MSEVTNEGIVIKSESLPERCEICHQEDEFNPSNGDCARCKGLALQKTQPVVEPITPEKTLESLKRAQEEWEAEQKILQEHREEERNRAIQIRLEEERNQLNRWRTDHAKEYEKSLNEVLPLFMSGFAPQVIAKQSFDAKCALIKGSAVAVFRIVPLVLNIGLVSIVVSFFAAILLSTLIWVLVPEEYKHAPWILVLQPLFCIMIFVIALNDEGFTHAHLLAIRKIIRFLRLHKKWNRKIGGQEVLFEPTIHKEGSRGPIVAPPLAANNLLDSESPWEHRPDTAPKKEFPHFHGDMF